MKSKAISLKFVSKSNKAVGYLMVETEDENFAKQTALQWAKNNLEIPFASVELHQGVLDSPGTHLKRDKSLGFEGSEFGKSPAMNSLRCSA